ncbi:MAG: type III-A CRISPR-associated RAMP protein Csm5, partial [Desulfatibacillaceae bacterium]|nr:type III-A CRISPR-associated RAMP protein Csm5 [Desulfatibacillaceae bacterium]
NRYQLKKGSGATLGEEIRESIKLSGDRAYLPATSLKGAIANAIAWSVFDDVAPKNGNKREHALKAAGNEGKAQFKANHLDNCLFQDGDLSFRGTSPIIRGDAKESAMKGLVIRDSGPVGMLEHRRYDIFVCKGGKITPKGRPLALEAIPPGAQITADMYVQKDQLQRVRGYSPSQKAASILCNIDDFGKALWIFGKRLAEIEEEFYTDCGMPQIAAFFTENKNKSIFPIGFGTGWNSKTVGPLLDKSEIDTAKIRFPRGYPPPISRRLALDEDGKPDLPIGWVKFWFTDIDE